jgi:hypothetical protein
MSCNVDLNKRHRLFLLPYAKFDVARWIEELMPSFMFHKEPSITGMMSKL